VGQNGLTFNGLEGLAMNITETWAKSTTGRMQPSGDLYIRPKTRAEMLAPLAWHEKQLAVCRRYGVLADGTIGYEIVS
jgi:hypothetical protein